MIIIKFSLGDIAEDRITQYNEPEPISDRLLVTGGSEIRVQAAAWTVLVVLDAPKPEPDLRLKLETFRTVMRRLYTVVPSTDSIRQAWEQRISDIEDSMSSPNSRTRGRRGLFNLIGTISSKLFGTATEAQVEECLRHIEKAMAISSGMYHTANELVSVVNQTKNELQQKRKHVLDIENDVTQLKDEVDTLGTKVTDLDQQSHIDLLLSAFESTHNLWLRHHDRYQRQRASLELGWLTEEILPPTELAVILEHGRAAGLYAPNLEWFYEHVRIDPLWEDSERLVFEAELPLINNVNYLRYRIWTWPVPQNDTQYTVKLQSPEDVAVDTRTGGIFEPHSCLGANPAICRTGPIYGQGRLMCPRGILNGNTQQRQVCEVTVSKLNSPEGFAHELIPGLFVVFSYGEEYVVYCPARPEHRDYLETGLFKIKVEPGCRIVGKDWTIHGLIQGKSKVTLKLPTIPIVSMDLSDMLNGAELQKHLSKPIWKDLPEIRNLNLHNLNWNDEL